MIGSEIERFADVVVSTIKSALDPIVTRLLALEMRAPINGRDGRDGSIGPTGPRGEPGPAGKDADSSQITALQAEVAGLRLDLSVRAEAQAQSKCELCGPHPAHPGRKCGWEIAMGADCPCDLRPMSAAEIQAAITTEVARAIALIPMPKDGNDGVSIDPSIVDVMVAAQVEKAVALIPPAPAGKDGAPGQSVAMADVEALVVKAVEALPKPQDGRSVTLDELAPVVAEAVTKAVDALPKPKDGLGLVDAFVDQDGQLVQTFSDGKTKNVGRVVGRDADPADTARVIAEEVAKIPPPKDGAPGRDGTLENLKAIYDGDRTVTLAFKDGTPIEGGVIEFPIVLDRGVYKQGTQYKRADGVTWGGSFWIAQSDTTAKPGEASIESRAWRLAVKKGGDGKPGPVGKEGPVGKQGPQGPQGRQGY